MDLFCTGSFTHPTARSPFYLVFRLSSEVPRVQGAMKDERGEQECGNNIHPSIHNMHMGLWCDVVKVPLLSWGTSTTDQATFTPAGANSLPLTRIT